MAVAVEEEAVKRTLCPCGAFAWLPHCGQADCCWVLCGWCGEGVYCWQSKASWPGPVQVRSSAGSPDVPQDDA